MTTLMLIVVPKDAGPGYAGRPLKNQVGGVVTLSDGTELTVDKDVFNKIPVGETMVVDGVSYKINKVSMIMPTMGKVVLESLV